MAKQRRLHFRSVFHNNLLVIIDALRTTDLQTARRLREDVEATALGHGAQEYVQYIRVESGDELFSSLDDVLHWSQAGVRPIVHLEAHGHRERGIEIGASGEMVAWDALHERFARINRACKNNLGVVLASCWGMYVAKELSIEEPCPYYFLVASEHPVEAGFIDQMMRRFYGELIDTNELEKSMNHVSAEFQQFHCERFFSIAFGRYLKRGVIGKAGQARIERLVSGAIERGAPRNRQTLRSLRLKAKNTLKSQEAAYQKWSRRFLHGKVFMPYQQLLAFVRNDEHPPK